MNKGYHYAWSVFWVMLMAVEVFKLATAESPIEALLYSLLAIVGTTMLAYNLGRVIK